MTDSNDNAPTSKDDLKDLEKTEVLGKNEQAALEKIRDEKWKKYARVGLAALGAVPWVGSLMSASAAFSSEKEQSEVSKIFFLWAQEHETKLKELGATLQSVFERFDSFGEQITTRLESEEYLVLVRKTFRQWDQAETLEKKEMLRKLITNAAGISWAQDDLVRLFLQWLNTYHEFHFVVIREIYQNQQITRGQIWNNIKGEIPREDPAEADLFKLLVRDLNTGGVIRQDRQTNYAGQFVRQKPKSRGSRGSTYESAFEDTKPYVLTELGQQFVHYVMDDLAPQIEQSKNI